MLVQSARNSQGLACYYLFEIQGSKLQANVCELGGKRIHPLVLKQSKDMQVVAWQTCTEVLRICLDKEVVAFVDVYLADAGLVC